MRHLLTILAIVSASTAVAQYVPNSGQGFQFASSFNPAFTGVEDFTDIKLGYRYQWTGYGDGAPKFINAVANFRIKKPLDLVTNGVRMSNVNVLSDRTIVPQRKQIIHGFGVSAFHEKVGPINRLGGGVNYALNFPLSKKVRLAVGGSAIVENLKVGVGEIYVRDAANDPFYQYLLSSSSSHTQINVRAGVLVYARKFYLGFSYLPLVTSDIKSSDIAFSEAFYKGTAQVGYSFPVSAGVVVKPSIIALMNIDNSFSINYNVKAFIRDKLWLGATYRDTKSGLVLFGFDFTESLGASYSYEMSMDGMKQFSDGSHDLVLSIRLNNFKRLDQYTW